MEGEVKVKNPFKKDIPIKVASILFAVILWFVLNPINPVDFNVPLIVINQNDLQDKGMVLNNNSFPKYITVTVKGRFNNIKEGNFIATLDLSKVKSAYDKSLDVDISYTGSEKISINDMKIKPQAVGLDISQYKENQFHVQLEQTGTLKNNYEVISSSFSPETVTLNGLDTLINSVGLVKVTVDVNNLDKSLDVKKDIKVYSKSGDEIPELSKGLTTEVKLQVAKRVSVVAITKGIPAKNYIKGQAIVKPDKVLITGTSDALNNIDVLETEPVNIENADKNLNVSSIINLPDGVKLANASKQVSVSVTIEQLAQKDFKISSDDITINNTEIDNSLTYMIQTNEIIVTLKGNKNQLDRLSIKTLAPCIDVGGLTEGVYNIPVKLVLPDTVKSFQDYSIDLNVIAR
jgi:YbbR domain-containing protein